MLENLIYKKDIRTFSVCAENPTGKKGEGGKALPDPEKVTHPARELGQGWKVKPCLSIPAGETFVIADIEGQGMIKHIWMTDLSEYGRQLLLRIYFDGQKSPAVDVPLSDFFCNADCTDFRQINSLAICCNPNRGMNCYFQMPYFKSFRVEVENTGEKKCTLFYQIDCEEKELSPDALYFHAQFRRVNPLPYKEVYTILDNIKGNGLYVGTYMHWGTKSNGWWGEGEIKFYIDGDTDFPSICGTGTEDYFCGAWCYLVNDEYVEYSTNYTGLSKVRKTGKYNTSQQYFDMYRWHVTDPIYFKQDLKVTIQALGWRNNNRYLPLQDDISSVAYWYSDNLEDIYPPRMSKDELELL